MLSYGGAAIALIMTGPSVLFGAVAKVTAWSNVEEYWKQCQRYPGEDGGPSSKVPQNTSSFNRVIVCCYYFVIKLRHHLP